MTTIYKLTDQNMQTHNGYQWALGETRTASGEGGLCGPGFLHGYTDPLLAVLLNPIHANITNPRLFRGEGTVAKTDHGLKIGCTEMTLTEEMEPPAINTVQRVAFGILCAKEINKDEAWGKWADDWLSGKDRTEAAWAAWAAAWEAADIDLIAIAHKAMEAT